MSSDLLLHLVAALLVLLIPLGLLLLDAGSIRASYVLRDGRLFVENVSVDGVALSGKVDLSPSAKCTSGGGI